MPEINQAWLALIGALLGGSGLKFIEHWLNRSKVTDDSAAQFRQELRDEVKNLREELRKTEEELEKWRGQYYTLMEQFLEIKNELDIALRVARINVEKVAEEVENG